MTSLLDSDAAPDTNSTDSVAAAPDQEISSSRVSLLSSLVASFSVFGAHSGSSSGEKKAAESTSYAREAVNRVVGGGGGGGGRMRRFQERILGTAKVDVLSSESDVWLLGSCYRGSAEGNSDSGNGPAEFLQDFSSRIWITYRKGFDAIEDSKFTSDANWGCMIRSSQMLVAQALIVHYLGRSWRKPLQKPYDPQYIEILHLFGDSETRAFSIHNLLQAGRNYGLAVGSWLGPYAMCRTWETLARANREQLDPAKGKVSLPMVVYIVSGDEDGERGGAPTIYIDVAARLCSDFSKGQLPWTPMLLLVPLVLGLDKVNRRYVPLLRETLTFPQSLGIMGGRPGASTYIVGIQDDKALYLDPHEVQPAVDIKRDDLEANTSSYHCSSVRHLQLDSIDPSLAIGFYCRDKDDFEDLYSRASKLGDCAKGAPLFTVAESPRHTKPNHHQDVVAADSSTASGDSGIDNALSVDNLSDCEAFTQEDDWQIL